MKLFALVLCVAALSAPSFAGKIKALAKRNISGRIIGGQDVNVGQFPSAAAIYVFTFTGVYFCGGSLISHQWVLTAAHCIAGGEVFVIMLGSNTIVGIDPNRKLLSTTIYVNHPDFNPHTLENDVGLVKFRRPIEYNDYIQPVYLPTMPTIDNVATTAIGWGQTSDDNAGIVNELNYVRVTTISNAECQLTYSNTIFDTMVCVAGNYNEGPCRGDSGSPLLLTLNHHHWTVGVASFISSNGCESTDPSGYTRILPYVDWIKTTAEIV